MRKTLTILVILSLVVFASLATAGDKIMTTKISSATEAVDRNGNDYVRFIIDEERNIQGVKYTVGVPVMCFGNTVAKAKTYKTGDTLKAVVQEREYQSRKSYTVVSFLK